jgi:type VI protein secretion system component VasK
MPERRANYREFMPLRRTMLVWLLTVAAIPLAVGAISSFANNHGDWTQGAAVDALSAIACLFAAAMLWSLCELVALAKAREARESKPKDEPTGLSPPFSPADRS